MRSLAFAGLFFACLLVSVEAQEPTRTDVAYGEDERQVLDFWAAKTKPGSGPRPLLVYIHGGGWTTGDKAKESRVRPDFSLFLENGISCAAINYRLAPMNPLPAPVHDAARAIQFLRFQAEEWNLRKDRFALTGGSAGACTSMWILCHDDLADPESPDPIARESTRVQGAHALAGQSCIDPLVIESWLGPKVLEHRMIWFSVGEPDMASALANYDEHEEAYREFSAYNHVSADDPPLFLTYFEALTLPSTSGGHGIHHPVLGLKMKEKYEEVGAKCHLVVSDRYDAGTEFLLDVLLK